MIVTLDLPDDVAATLNALPTTLRNNFAVARLSPSVLLTESGDKITLPLEADDDVAALHEARTWWDGLTDAQRAQETARTIQALHDGDAGRVSSLPDVVARLRAKYGTAGTKAVRWSRFASKSPKLPKPT